MPTCFFQDVEDCIMSFRRPPRAIFKRRAASTLRAFRRTAGANDRRPDLCRDRLPLGAYNPFNPFQQIISGGTRRAIVRVWRSRRRYVTDAFFTTLGAEGDKLFDGSWGYDAGFRYSQIKNTGTSRRLRPRALTGSLMPPIPFLIRLRRSLSARPSPTIPLAIIAAPSRRMRFPVDFAYCHRQRGGCFQARDSRSQHLHDLALLPACRWGQSCLWRTIPPRGDSNKTRINCRSKAISSEIPGTLSTWQLEKGLRVLCRNDHPHRELTESDPRHPGARVHRRGALRSVS